MKKKKEEILERESMTSEEAAASLATDSDTVPSVEEKMEKDIALFHKLFPDVKDKDIPQEVWERVEAGESLSAAYALYTVEKNYQEEAIRKVNEKNEKKAPPRVRHDGGEGEYYSPEAVRAMTGKEVRKHYNAILRSMEHWN